jgi:hypothetical protein
VLGSLECHSVDDVATQLGVPIGTVKSRSFAARRRLKRTLGNAGLVILLLGGAVALLPWVRLIGPTGELPQVARVVVTPPTIAVPAPPPVGIARALRSADSHRPLVVEQFTQSTSVSVKRIEVPVVSPIAAIDLPVVEVPVVEVPVVRVPTTTVPVVDGPPAIAPVSRLEKQ